MAEVAERLPVSRPAVLQHLKVLAEAGLLQRDSIGTRNLYRPDTDGVRAMREFIDSLRGTWARRDSRRVPRPLPA